MRTVKTALYFRTEADEWPPEPNHSLLVTDHSPWRVQMSRKKGGNFYSALMGSAEPEAVNQEIAEALDRRKNGAAAAAAAEHSSDDDSVFKHPLVWIDLEM